MKPAKVTGIQYASLPFRMRGRRVEVLLITSRETRRWVIPKGWPIKGLSPPDGAAREAAEEAGLIGAVQTKPIGSFNYSKSMKGGERLQVQVIVFPLQVEAQQSDFLEIGQREMRWFPYHKAAALVAEPSLRRLIREFGRNRTPHVLETLRAWNFNRRDTAGQSKTAEPI